MAGEAGQLVPKILIVNDGAKSIKLIEGYLSQDNYQILSALGGEEALKIVDQTHLDLILLDIMTPGLDGYEVCKRLKKAEQTRLTPVVVITALRTREDRIKGSEAGADDFLTKPVDQVELLTRVRSLLKVKSLIDQFEETEQALYSLVIALEKEYLYIKGHSIRVSRLSIELAQALGLLEEQQILLGKACLFHDVGKIGIKASILNKPGPLAEKEYASIKEHSVKGEKICKPLAFPDPFLAIIRHHHEWWNGRGYPDGLMFKSIPLGARIMAIADAYDAMTSHRPYRASMLSMKALDKLEDGAAKQWDPDLVKVFVSIYRERHKRGLRRSYAPLW